jgi:hypothetical protein
MKKYNGSDTILISYNYLAKLKEVKIIAAAKRSSELGIRVLTKDIAGEQVSL